MYNSYDRGPALRPTFFWNVTVRIIIFFIQLIYHFLDMFPNKSKNWGISPEWTDMTRAVRTNVNSCTRVRRFFWEFCFNDFHFRGFQDAICIYCKKKLMDQEKTLQFVHSFHCFITYVPVLHKARRIIQSENNTALISLISWYEDYENILKERLFTKSNITPPYYWFVFLTLVKNNTTVRNPPNHHWEDQRETHLCK